LCTRTSERPAPGNEPVKNINRTFNEELGHEHENPEYLWTISDFEEYSGLKLNISFGLKLGVKL